jgi:prolyl oligopeptidase
MRRIVVGLAAAALLDAAAIAQQVADDPYVWLEEVSSARAMEWVAAHNARSLERLEADARYPTLYGEALAIAGSRDRIPAPRFRNGVIHNFWQDPQHLRGLLRKTTLADYRSAEPGWTTVLDFDALGKAEGRRWVNRGLECLRPDERLCLVSLSDGGEDALEVREFDLTTNTFVTDGFRLPRGKHRVAWEDNDHLLVATAWTPADVTQSGYPFIVKRVTRGQPLSAAIEVFRGRKDDGGYGVQPRVLRDGKGNQLTVIVRPLDTSTFETYVLTARGPERLAVPPRVSIAELVDGRVVLQVNEYWSAAGAEFTPGSVADVALSALAAAPGRLAATIVWKPGPRETLEQIRSTRDKLLLLTLDNVRGRVSVLTPQASGGWTTTVLPLPDNLTITFGVAPTDQNSNLLFVQASGFLTPTTLYLADAGTGAVSEVKKLPAQFRADAHVVEQLEATSSDGTKIPYFLVRPKDVTYDASTPTILEAYGGFQESETPTYRGMLGKLWLERGGAFVLANIRGGGEFGPKWHEAGLGVKRQIVYDDFCAVAKDLIARRVTSPRRLGIQGNSNGGLLMGVAMTQRPELWNAVLLQVPLLDMLRVSKIAAGASWRGEYGDVDGNPAVRDFWMKTSPFHNLREGVRYPEPFLFTTTKDDRVGPQHARKFAARLEEMGLPFYYYEHTEGGHGSGADVKQTARANALWMTYFARKLLN